jgi:hypothetical protein
MCETPRNMSSARRRRLDEKGEEKSERERERELFSGCGHGFSRDVKEIFSSDSSNAHRESMLLGLVHCVLMVMVG